MPWTEGSISYQYRRRERNQEIIIVWEELQQTSADFERSLYEREWLEWQICSLTPNQISCVLEGPFTQLAVLFWRLPFLPRWTIQASSRWRCENHDFLGNHYGSDETGQQGWLDDLPHLWWNSAIWFLSSAAADQLTLQTLFLGVERLQQLSAHLPVLIRAVDYHHGLQQCPIHDEACATSGANSWWSLQEEELPYAFSKYQ